MRLNGDMRSQARARANVNRMVWNIIESTAGEPVGLIGHYWKITDANLGVSYVEVRAGVSWLAVAPSALRYLQATAQAYAQRDSKPADRVNFWLAQEHPFFAAAAGSTAPNPAAIRLVSACRRPAGLPPPCGARLGGASGALHRGRPHR